MAISDRWHQLAELRWRSCRPFGAEVQGDLSVPLSQAAARGLVALFREEGLVVARRQALNRDRHNALLSLIGNVVMHRQGDPGYIFSDGLGGQGSSRLSWHADAAYSETPFEALSLHALDVVDGASSTRFVNVEKALTTLPSRLREVLDTHDADMRSAGVERVALRLCDIREHPNSGARARLPSIRTNHGSGRRYIAVSEMQTAGLHDMPWEESRAVLNSVFDHLYAPLVVHEHRWHGGDLVLWDNLACQHERGWLDGTGMRKLQRVIVGPQSVAVPDSKME